MDGKVCAGKAGVNDVEKPDVFVRQQSALDAARRIGESVDVWGNTKTSEDVPCDCMATFKIEDCKTCKERDRCGGEKQVV